MVWKELHVPNTAIISLINTVCCFESAQTFFVLFPGFPDAPDVLWHDILKGQVTDEEG